MEVAWYMGTGAAVGFVGVCTCVVVWRRRRRRRECWFCHHSSRGQPEGGWTCPSCQQYNGFTEEGDYNREMVEQCTGPETPLRYCCRGPTPSPAPPTAARDLLCPQCQLNLQLKVTQLASFQPASEESFQEEAIEYERLVEKLYPLCGPCEQRVAMEINQRNKIIRTHLLKPSSRHKEMDKGQKDSRTSSCLVHLLEWASSLLTLTLLTSLFVLPLLPEGDWCTGTEEYAMLGGPWTGFMASLCWVNGHILVLLTLMAVTDVICCLLRRDLGLWHGAMLLMDTTTLCLHHPTCTQLLQLVARDSWTGVVAGRTGLALTIAVRLASWMMLAARKTSVKGSRKRSRKRRRREWSKEMSGSTHVSQWEIHESLGDLSIDSDDSKCGETSHKSWLQTVTDLNLLGDSVVRDGLETSKTGLTRSNKGRPLLRPSRLTRMEPQTDTLCSLVVKGGDEDGMSRESPPTAHQHQNGLMTAELQLSAANRMQAAVQRSSGSSHTSLAHICSYHCIMAAVLAGSISGNVGLLCIVVSMHYL